MKRDLRLPGGIDAALLDEGQVGQHQEKRISMKKKTSTKLI